LLQSQSETARLTSECTALRERNNDANMQIRGLEDIISHLQVAHEEQQQQQQHEKDDSADGLYCLFLNSFCLNKVHFLL
jgi:hypothetical protein